MTPRKEDKHRRTWFDIWALILDLLVEDDATLNGIVTSTKLNRQSVKHHLEDMVSLHLVQANHSTRFVTYSITKEGVRWIKGYKGIAMNPSGKADNRTDFG
jgi:predicted transcriptional regulator